MRIGGGGKVKGYLIALSRCCSALTFTLHPQGAPPGRPRVCAPHPIRRLPAALTQSTAVRQEPLPPLPHVLRLTLVVVRRPGSETVLLPDHFCCGCFVLDALGAQY